MPVYNDFAGSLTITVYGHNIAAAQLRQMSNNADRKIFIAMNAALIKVDAEAKRLIRVGYYKPAIDTGLMRNSITHKVTDVRPGYIAGVVGGGVFYALYVHEGMGYHRIRGARPFLVDAAVNMSDSVDLLLNKVLFAIP